MTTSKIRGEETSDGGSVGDYQPKAGGIEILRGNSPCRVCGVVVSYYNDVPDPSHKCAPKWCVTEVPADYNGYCQVPRPPIRVRADEVQPGDVLVVDGLVTKVTGVATYALANRESKQVIGTSYPPHHDWPVLYINCIGTAVVRLPDEIVTVVR